MTRIHSLVKLAKETLSERAFTDLNFLLSEVHGWDSIDAVLLSHGISRGKKFEENKYRLNSGSEQIQNAYLVGTYEGAKIVLGDVPKAPERKIPWDAFFSPSALYEREEKENEDE